MPYEYSQTTGVLTRNGKRIAVGYSGHGEGLNNPDAQGVRAVGPLPQGRWRMGGVYNSANVGPYAIILDPEASTQTFGRTAFRIHGDNKRLNKTASNGCLIFSRSVREAMWKSGDRIVIVTR